ncbi:hypothetical protein, partial [Gordonia jinhuaensis]|uniref:hypothetical protein n=1 Tax=Gordonia jinhuaensis TaxID=1517702 RepID=UPI001E33512E
AYTSSDTAHHPAILLTPTSCGRKNLFHAPSIRKRRFRPPSDYREIVQSYGPGRFASEIFVFTPRGPEGMNIYAETQKFREILDDPGWQETVDEIGYQWCEPDGNEFPIQLAGESFTAWGGASAGAYGYWHQIGDDPDDWPAIYTDLGGFWLYDRGGLASLLVNAPTGQFPPNTIDPSVAEYPAFTRWF